MNPGRLPAAVALLAFAVLPASAQDSPAPATDLSGDPLPEGALIRAGTVRFRLSAGVTAAALSPDGTALAAAGPDGAIRWIELPSGAERRTLKGHEGAVVFLVFAPDGRRLASTGDDGTVRLWDAADGKPLAVLQGHTMRVAAGAFSPDGATLATGGGDGTLRLWDIPSGRELRKIEAHRGEVAGVAFAPDGRAVATGGADGAVRLWDPAAGTMLREHAVNAGGVTCLAFSPDGKSLASGGWDRVIRIRDAAGAGTESRMTGHDEVVTALRFATDGRSLLSAGADGTIRQWDPATGKETARIRAHLDAISALADAPSRSLLVSAGRDGILRRWLLRQDASGSRGFEEIVEPRRHLGPALGVAWSPDGRILASAGADHAVRLWEAGTGRWIADLRGHRDAVFAVAFSPDGRLLVTGSRDGTFRIWDPAGRRELLNIAEDAGGVTAAAFSPDGRRLATGGEDRQIRIREITATGTAGDSPTAVPELREIRRIAGHEGRILSLQFIAGGLLLASRGDDNTARIWNPDSGRETTRILGLTERMYGAAPSPDARVLAVAVSKGSFRFADRADHRVRLWEAASGREILATDSVLGEVDGPGCLAWSPDGRVLARGRETAVRFWSAASGAELRHGTCAGGRPLAAAFAPDGKRLATAMSDGNVLVWSAPEAPPPAAGAGADAAPGILWTDLASTDAGKAWRAVRAIAARGAAGDGPLLALLKENVRPSADDRILRLVADLDSDAFETRERATHALRELGPSAEPVLRQALASSTSAEVTVRLNTLLDALGDPSAPLPAMSAETLRNVRAVQALERMGTPEAHAILEAVAGGIITARETWEARAALERLDRGK